MISKEKLKSWINNHLVLTFSLVAQILSILLFLCTYCSDQLVEKHAVKIPTLQNLFAYCLLFLLFSVVSLVKRNTLSVKSIKSNWYKYFFYALFDVEANFSILNAFQYTSPASIQLLDASIIPIVMILSILLLRTKYKLSQYLGAFITVVGTVSLVLVDVKTDFSQFQRGKNPLAGDLLVLTACLCYAGSNVIAEYLTADSNIGELLFFHGLFGSLIVIIQGGILEYKTLINTSWNTPSIWLIISYTIVLTCFYLLVPIVIKHIKASGFNVSLVTTDIYTVIYNAVTYTNLTPLYAIGGIVITAGCVIFNAQPLYTEYKNAQKSSAKGNNTDTPPYMLTQNV